MILDLFPFIRPGGRLPRPFGRVRYLRFGLSLGTLLLLLYGFDFRDGAAGRTAMTWFIISNLFYYAVGIILAYALKDNRAFYKCLCPITVPLKITSRLSLLKIGQGAG